MRTKIILPNLLAVFFVGILTYFYLGTSLQKKAAERLGQQLQITSQLSDRSEALRGFDLLFDVRKQAMTKAITQAFAPVEIEPIEGEEQKQTEKRIRQVWFQNAIKAVESYSEIWQQKGKKPEIVFVTDRNGVVVARNTTPNACPAGRNVSGAMSVVKRALDGEATYAIWSIDDSPFSKKNGKAAELCSLVNTGMLEMAAAPVWLGDDVAGALVIGFEISNGAAVQKSKLIGMDFAVYKAGNIYSSSFATDTARQSLSEQLIQKDVATKISKVINDGKRSDVFQISIENKPYLAQISPVISADKKGNIANVFMASIDDAAYFHKNLSLILVFMGVAVLMVIIIGFFLGSHFINPVMQIEEGLLRIINGEYEYRFDVNSREVGGLSYRINQLVSVLTGEEEESDED